MGEVEPVTLWIDQLRVSDNSAAQKVWEHFVNKLYALARKKLKSETRRVYDEEDAAQSAFNSVCAGIAAGRFPQLTDRTSLWHLMLVITSRKVSSRHRHETRQRRDVRRNLTDSFYVDSVNGSDGGVVGQLSSREPTPEFAAEFTDVWESLLHSLDDPSLQKVAALRVEGFTDFEISKKLKCSRRTVHRRLEVIRRHWEELHVNDE